MANCNAIRIAIRHECYIMTKEEVQQGLTVIKQILLAMGYTQRALARDWDCTPDKVSRATRGTEPTFTAREVKVINRWLQDNFGKTWDDMPDSMISEEVVDFLQPAIESQQKSGS